MHIDLVGVTGGPAAGKTTVKKDIEEHWSTKAVVAPEAASVLIEHLIASPGEDLNRWIENLQKCIYPSQRSSEQSYLDYAQRNGLRMVIADRGVLDGAAYLPGGMEQYSKLVGINPEEELKRYSMIIHLESVATVSEDLWNQLKSTNPARYETHAQAVERELALRAVYQDHPNYHFVSGKDGIEVVKARVRAILGEYLDTEIERKWLMSMGAFVHLKKHFDIKSCRSVKVRQGYITDKDQKVELRIREMGNECFITIKGGEGLSRSEWERSLPKAEFEAMWPQTEGRRIEKTRYYVPLENHTIELDEFAGEHAGLYLFEVEFNSTIEAENFVLPELFQGSLDVTKAKQYKNKALAC